MARLVDDLLDVGRAVTGKIVLKRTPRRISPRRPRRRVATIASGNATTSGRIDLVSEPVWVNGDAGAARADRRQPDFQRAQVLAGRQAIVVSVCAEGDEAVLRVADQGIGISADMLPNIFDLFVQAHHSIDRAGGLGIGLTLVRRLAELHGGTIEAVSPGTNGGSKFCVRLQAVQPPAGEQSTASAAATGPRTQRVLLVDDHADARTMYMMVLEAEGHQVFQAEDGLAAVEMFRSVRPDVAVIDIGLPHMDGYEVARQIRKETGGQDVTLIALTGYGFPEDRERSRAAGFDQHLVKPAMPDDLKREMEEATRRRTAASSGTAHA